ncbi:Uncharacterized protein PHSC3_001649 [Chlamydiales bacterium STE3]|nr:Uncharacterized protein PHSC3_001649 [Chlamydiales bacterium STE3]
MPLFKHIFFLLVITFSSSSLHSTSNTCEELLHFVFDDRQWKKSFEESNEESSIIEFTLENESIKNWSELVSVQRFTNIHVSLNEYYKILVAKLKELSYPYEAHMQIINRAPDSLLAEWWIDKGSPLAQHEWLRMFKTPSSIMLLRYTTKQLNEVEKVRRTWEKILNDASILSKGDCS